MLTRKFFQEKNLILICIRGKNKENRQFFHKSNNDELYVRKSKSNRKKCSFSKSE